MVLIIASVGMFDIMVIGIRLEPLNSPRHGSVSFITILCSAKRFELDDVLLNL